MDRAVNTSPEGMEQTADLTTAGSVPWAAKTQRERNFWIALGCAALLHGSAFVGAFTSKPKYIGDPEGSEKTLSVSLITEADLQSQSTAVEPPKPPPGAEPRPPQKAQPAQPKPPEQQAKEEPEPTPPDPQKQEPEKVEEQPVKAEEAKPEEAKPVEEKVAKAEEKAEALPQDLFTLDVENPAGLKVQEKPQPKPQEAAKASPKKQVAKKPAAKKPKRLSSLDLSTPRDMAEPSFNPGRSAAFQRPPGITRSGLNDAFARAVIRALQQTMPQLMNTFGRVTVRIFLTESGNVQEVRLLAGAKDASLNQDVVFAARQTSYPIPPAGSNVADRTFMVTYIYD